MQFSFQKRLVTWSVMIALVLSVVGAMIFKSVSGLLDDTAWVTHTHIVIGKLAEVLSLVKDAETSQRGYIITGQEQYLKPYHAAIPLLKQNLAELKALTKDNPTQQQRLLPLTTAIQSRLPIAQTIIDVRRTQGFPFAQRFILKGDGRRQMDLIRSRIAHMDEAERRLLRIRSNNAQTASCLASIVGASGRTREITSPLK